MPIAQRADRAKRAQPQSVYQTALGLFIGLYLIVSLLAEFFHVESAWTWPVDLLDLASHMVANHCIFPGSHS